MKEKWLPVYYIVQRELQDQLRDWRILFPMIVLSIFFPIAMTGIAQGVIAFINRFGGNLIIRQLIPFSVLIVGFFPLTLSLTISLESIVGERERGTIEPLLSTPLESWQIYMGKFFAGLLAPISATFFSITFYLVLAARQGIELPSASLLTLLYLVSFSNGLLMVSGTTFLSAQSTTVRGATLASSFIVVPVSLFLQAESYLLFWKNEMLVFWAVLGAFLLAMMLLRLGLAYFQREYLLGREIDELNLRRTLRQFWQAFRGQARTPWEWYRQEVPNALRQIRPAILILLALIPLIFALTFYVADVQIKPLWERYRAEQAEVSAAADGVSTPGAKATLTDGNDGDGTGSLFGLPVVPLLPRRQASLMRFIFTHNLSAMVMALLLGLMSFGVYGVAAYLMNIGLIALLWRLTGWLGYSPPMLFALGVLPHGIFELPAILLGFATVYHLGARLLTPAGAKPLSEVLIEEMALWARIFIGVLFPLLLIAAAIEANITPLLLLSYLDR